MHRLKFFIQQSWLLIVVAFCCGLLLALTNAALKPRIEKNEVREMNDKMKNLMQQAAEFKKVVSEAAIAGNVTDVYEATGTDKKVLGFAFIGSGPGFADKIKLVIAVNRDCTKLLGFEVLFSNETPGFGSRITETWFRDQFVDAPAETLEVVKGGDSAIKDNRIVALTGATVSSDAVVKIFNNHIAALRELLKQEGLIQ